MRYSLLASLTAAAFVLAAPAVAHMTGMGGGRVGDFGHGFGHGHPGFHIGPLPFPFHERNLVVPFPNVRFGEARFEGWGGGAYGGDVAAAYDDEGEDFTPEDLHFRVEEPFGPGDIGRQPPPEPYAARPWDGARDNSLRGYEPQDR